MARVVQRSGPPYLTILFVFLFFIAAILAVWFFTQSRSTYQQAEQTKASLSALASAAEMNDQRMTEHKMRAQGEGNTAVGQFRSDIETFVQAIAGGEAPVGDALALAEQLKQMSDGNGLFAFVQQLQKQLTEMQQALQAMEKSFADLKNATQTEAQAAATAADELERQLNAAKADATAARADLKKISEDYSGQVADATKQWTQRTEELQQTLASREDEIRQLQQKVRELEKVIRDWSNPEDNAVVSDASMGADANIIRVADNQQVVFIDIGKLQKVRIGLPFTVYSQRTGVVPEGDGKARIIVKNAFDRVAECEVVSSDPSDPISEGDPVANVAFNANASPTFVVAGKFDLDGDGRPDSNGKQAIISMIERFGGAIVSDVSVEVDYVVLGSEPANLTRPSADAPEAEMELWRQNEADRQRYQDMLQKTINYNKPVLNTSRFLTFIGYSPEVIR